VNRYSRLNFKYNYIKPGVAFEYNIDDGVFLGADVQYVKQGFRKEPYSMRHYFMGSYAFLTGSFHFKYDADFIKVFRNNDILIRSDFRAPVNVANFFGIGNNTVNEKTINQLSYYRAKYDISNVSVYVRRQLQSWMRINFGPSFQYFSLDSAKNVGRYVDQHYVPINGGNKYERFAYLGGDLRLDINSKNNEQIPTRGFVLDMGVRPLYGLKEEAHNIVQTNIDMRIYMSLYTQKKLVLAMRFGWAKNYGKYEFPQAMYLGQTDNLRGYRKQRFAGRSMLFNNTELRIRLFDFNTYLFPGSFGINVFNDIGRVWADNEDSQKWHDGYGGGIWIAPIKRFVLALSIAHSDEENFFPRLTFGFQF
jgi:hypothetical protein